MSVLVESPSLIVRRAALDVRYPGRMNGFLRDMELPEHRVLRACVDSHLVCVSFLLVMHARMVANKLETLGLKHIVDGQCVDLAIAGKGGELDLPCSWMAIATHLDGYRHASLGASEPGELSAPEGWDYERAVRTEMDTFGDEWHDCARISNVDGLETWLDYRTGEMETRASTGPSVSLSPSAAPKQVTHGEPLMPVLLGALVAANIAFTRGEETSVAFGAHRASGFYYHRMIVDEQERGITCFCTLGTHVPEAQRPAVAELLLRMSERSSDCMLMLDSDTGWVSALTYRRIEAAVCTTSDIISLWNRITEFTEVNCESIMRVAFGGMSPYEYAPYTPDSE